MIRLGIDWRECEAGKSTGIRRYLTGLCRYLLRPGQPWELKLFGNQQTEWDPFIPDRVKARLVEKNRIWWDQVLLPRAMKHYRCQLFLSPYFKAPVFSPCPLVLIVNDLIPRHPYYRWLLRLNVIRSAGVIAISNTTQKDLVKSIPSAGAKTAVIPLGVESRFSPGEEDRSDLRQRVELKGDYLLYVGNAQPHKNLPALLRAIKEFPSIELVLCGVDPRLAPDLPRLAAIEGILKRVHFLPHLGDEDLVSLYRGATLFVFPSLQEGFGLPPLEAMACGVPVVASRIPSTEEVLGEAAYFVDASQPKNIAQGVRVLLEQPALRKKLIDLGKARAALYSPLEMASSMADFLKSIHQERKRI